MQYTLFSTVGSDYAGGDDMIKLLFVLTPCSTLCLVLLVVIMLGEMI